MNYNGNLEGNFVIEMESVSKIFHVGETEIKALNNISIKIAKGEYVAIVGHSGSGKSTLINIIGCIDTPTEGKYYLNGEDVNKIKDGKKAIIRNKEIGFVFQDFNLIEGMTAFENVELPLVYAKVGKTKRKEMVMTALARVGLAKRANHKPGQMSGGQKQRVAIARAIVTNPVLVLADEPTGNLDFASESEIVSILEDINKEGRTLIIITHNPEIAKKANRTIEIKDGTVVKDEKVNNNSENINCFNNDSL